MPDVSLDKSIDGQLYDLEHTIVWSFPQRGGWATNKSNYRGNFAPQRRAGSGITAEAFGCVQATVRPNKTDAGDLPVGEEKAESWLFGLKMAFLNTNVAFGYAERRFL